MAAYDYHGGTTEETYFSHTKATATPRLQPALCLIYDSKSVRWIPSIFGSHHDVLLNFLFCLRYPFLSLLPGSTPSSQPRK